MTARTIVEAFADAAARLAGRADVAGDLVALLGDCVALMEMDSAGLLVDVPGEGLAVLSSTSHATDLLELYELQNGHGPCIQATQDNEIVTGLGEDLEHNWEPVGRAIVGAGFHAVYAFPLRWQERAVGALNLFAIADHELDDDQRRMGQAFANMAVAVLSHTRPSTWGEIHELIVGVLSERIAVEQAKGVLAVQNNIELSDAYTLLVATARQQGVPLSELATRVISSARQAAP